MTLQEIADDIKGKRSLSDIDEVFLKSRILERVETYKIDINEEFKKLKRKDRYKEFFKDIRKTYGVEVILAYFTDRKRKSAFSLSNHLWKAVDKRILIKRKHFEN